MLLAYAAVGPSFVKETDTTLPLVSGKCSALHDTLEGCHFSALKWEKHQDYGIDSAVLIEQAMWSITLYMMNVCVIGSVCCLTFHLKHLVPDPYDKLGHGWAHPSKRKLYSAKRQALREHKAREKRQSSGNGAS